MNEPTKIIRLGHVALRYRRIENGWQLWINADANFRVGTFILLKDDGTREKHHIYADGGIEILDLAD